MVGGGLSYTRLYGCWVNTYLPKIVSYAQQEIAISTTTIPDNIQYSDVKSSNPLPIASTYIPTMTIIK